MIGALVTILSLGLATAIFLFGVKVGAKYMVDSCATAATRLGIDPDAFDRELKRLRRESRWPT